MLFPRCNDQRAGQLIKTLTETVLFMEVSTYVKVVSYFLSLFLQPTTQLTEQLLQLGPKPEVKRCVNHWVGDRAEKERPDDNVVQNYRPFVVVQVVNQFGYLDNQVGQVAQDVHHRHQECDQSCFGPDRFVVAFFSSFSSFLV